MRDSLAPRLYDVLVACAANGEVCPSNDALKWRFGLKSTGSIARWLGVLVERGMITIERGNHARRVTITATGAITAAPPTGLLGRSGVPKAPAAPRTELHRVTRAQVDDATPAPPTLAQERALSRQERARLKLMAERIKVHGPARTCRAIVAVPIHTPLDHATLERARAGDESIYCGQPSAPGCSYCAAHRQRFIPPRRRMPARPSLDVPTDSVERAFYRKCRNEGLNHMQAISRVMTLRDGRNARNA